MYRGFHHHWQRGMRWGWHRRPCCCLFFALPLILVPLLALAALVLHFIGV
jgi:hypothetical protein